jgi:hypothetical protein
MQVPTGGDGEGETPGSGWARGRAGRGPTAFPAVSGQSANQSAKGEWPRVKNRVFWGTSPDSQVRAPCIKIWRSDLFRVKTPVRSADRGGRQPPVWLRPGLPRRGQRRLVHDEQPEPPSKAGGTTSAPLTGNRGQPVRHDGVDDRGRRDPSGESPVSPRPPLGRRAGPRPGGTSGVVTQKVRAGANTRGIAAVSRGASVLARLLRMVGSLELSCEDARLGGERGRSPYAEAEIRHGMPAAPVRRPRPKICGNAGGQSKPKMVQSGWFGWFGGPACCAAVSLAGCFPKRGPGELVCGRKTRRMCLMTARATSCRRREHGVCR